MKQIFLTIISVLLLSIAFTQQNPWYISQDIESADTCDFSYMCNFISIEPDSQWEQGGTDKPFFSDNFAGSGLMTDTIDFYSESDTSYFQVDFTGMLNYYDNFGGQALSIEFKHKMDSDTLKDGGFITISLDSGQTWHNVADMDESQWGPDYDELIKYKIYSNTDTLFNGEKGFSGNFDWVTSGIQIVFQYPVKGLNTDPMMRFNFVSDNISNNLEGWIIDSLVIAEQYIGSSLDEFGLNQSKLLVYPNPTLDKINISLSSNEVLMDGSLILMDFTGRVIRKENINNTEKFLFDVSELKSGIYTVKWIGKDGVIINRRVVIN